MDVVLPNGLRINGDPAQVGQIISQIFENSTKEEQTFAGFYRSASDGPIAVEQMNSQHMKNAVTLKLRNLVARLDSRKYEYSPERFAREVAALVADPEVFAMTSELATRKD